jgi:hypothetical protein
VFEPAVASNLWRVWERRDEIGKGKEWTRGIRRKSWMKRNVLKVKVELEEYAITDGG